MLKKILAFLTALSFLITGGWAVGAFGGNSLEAAISQTGAYIAETVSNPTIGSAYGEWAIISFARSGCDVPNGYYEKYYDNVTKYIADNEGVLHKTSYTEYSRVILALTASGYDPRDVAGYNLLLPLGDFNQTVWQGINGAVFALIALDASDYKIPENPGAPVQATRELYVAEILGKQLGNGGFNLSGTKADPDITAMALQALAKYTDSAEVTEAVNSALNCLAELQNSETASMGSPEATAQTIIALCELGITLDDPRFVKNKKTLLDSLLSFRNGDGGFKHAQSGGNNQMATEQSLCALAALSRAETGRNSFYRMEDAEKRIAAENPELPPSEVDKTTLEAAIAEAQSKVESEYTSASRAAMQDALATALEVFDNANASAADVDSAENGLRSAIAGLILAGSGGSTPSTQAITVTFSLFGAPKHSDSPKYIYRTNAKAFEKWIAPKSYTFAAASVTVYDVFVKALADMGLEAKYASGNSYVSSIKGPNGWIGEFDNGQLSGWMYTLGGKHVSLGLSEQTVKNGDIIVWHYTDDYTKEEGSEKENLASSVSGTVGNESNTTTAEQTKEEPDEISTDDMIEEKDLGTVWANPFKDISHADWFYTAVQYVVHKGIMRGTSSEAFAPNEEITRAMLVTMLCRLEGEPTVTGENPFSDVESGQWYTNTIIWAVERGIVEGIGGGLFAPNDSLTREQIATILYRYAAKKGLDITGTADLSAYTDISSISDWATSAMRWANAEGIINGYNAAELAPGTAATRAEVAAMIMRYIEGIW